MNHRKWHVLLVLVLIGIMLAAIVPPMIEVQPVAAQDPCPDDNNVWNPGMTAQVTSNLDVFNSPGPNGGVIGSIGSGEMVTIVGNYQCANWGTSWTRWQNVQTASGVIGWIAEKQYGRSTRLRSYSGSAPAQPSGDQTGSSPSGSGGGSTCPDSPNQWSVGMQAQLTERKDLQVSTDYNAPVIERVDRGAVVTIVGNFQCSSWGSAPIRWQYVRTASGNEGWIAEQQQGRNSRFAPYGGSQEASVQQSQAASSAPNQPQSQPAVVVDGCTDHPEQIYAGEASPPGGDYLRVDVANLRVRMGPSTSWCMNGYAVQGRYYPVHEVRDGWALITGTYGAGWLSTSYVTLYGNYDSSDGDGQEGCNEVVRTVLQQWNDPGQQGDGGVVPMDYSIRATYLTSCNVATAVSSVEVRYNLWDIPMASCYTSAHLALHDDEGTIIAENQISQDPDAQSNEEFVLRVDSPISLVETDYIDARFSIIWSCTTSIGTANSVIDQFDNEGMPSSVGWSSARVRQSIRLP